MSAVRMSFLGQCHTVGYPGVPPDSAALGLLKDHSEVKAVVQGPAAPNLDFDSRSLATDALERYKAVAEMARRVAESQDVLYVDRWDTVSPGFYCSGMARLSAQGHSVWGQLLADELLSAGYV